jgi:anti-sigma-K factor RskA
MNGRGLQIDRVERALRAAYREPERAGGTPPDSTVERIVMRVRACARLAREESQGDARFLWRFVSACAVAAAVLVAVAITNVPGEGLTLTPLPDDMVANVLNPTMPF